MSTRREVEESERCRAGGDRLLRGDDGGVRVAAASAGRVRAPAGPAIP